MSAPKQPVAIVSGASRGIGKATALKLLQTGYRVVGLYKTNEQAANAVVKHGSDMQKVNVGIESEVMRVVNYVARKYGQIDVIINNAGIDIPGKIESYTISNWNLMLASDLTSVFLLSKYSIPYLKKSDNPIIINVSSRLGINQYAEPDFVVYGAIKAAVNNLTVGLARELTGTGIRVNAVIPVPTKTDLFDGVFTPEEEGTLKAAGKLGSPEDVAELVIKLINDKSATGQLLFDGRIDL
jgi:3-oxoacyl-[acyl-carrier protein] reductase